MKRPSYFIVGIRPVKMVDIEGGVDILAFNWDTGEFESDLSYLDRLYLDYWEVEKVTEDEFNQQVEELRSKLSNG